MDTATSASLATPELLSDRPLLSVVIPAYNEEHRLPATIQRVLAYLRSQSFPWELIVIDDGSQDRTAELAEAFATDEPAMRVIRNGHYGKGYAVRTGVLAARGEFVLFSDADLAVPMEEWEKLRRYLNQGYDVVIGSREGAGAQRLGEPWHRHVMGRIFNLFVRLVAIGGIQDTQCGFKAFSRRAAHDLFNRMLLYGADASPVHGAAVTAFDVEVLFLATKRGYRICEVPVIWSYGEETKVNPLRDSWRNLRDVLRVRWNDLRGRYKG